MDFSMGGAGGSGDEQDNNQNSNKGKSSYHILSTYQKSQLEAFFKKCPHPDETEGDQLAKELGLEPKQIKFWFQNKRTQTKNRNERAYNIAIRIENERMQCENFLIRETMKSVVCPSCGGRPFGEEAHELSMRKLQLENAQLKEEHENISNLLARYLEKQMSQTQPESQLDPAQGSSYDPLQESSVNQVLERSGLDQDFDSSIAILDGDEIPNPTSGSEDMEIALMSEVATRAMDELLRLLSINEPLWVKSLDDGKFVLDRVRYKNMFPRANHFKSSNFRVESSKDARIVNIGGMKLVDMFLDSDEWVNLFPTIVSKAETINVLEGGLMGNRSGALQLMYEEMHVLSPLVPFRKFFFLRYCKQVEVGVWVITDVSFDSFKDHVPLSRSWKLPSGCMIREMPNGSSMVTWVEHVEVDHRIQTNRLYRDLVCNNIAYGAERWLVTLQRTCERFGYSSTKNIPSHGDGGVINSPEGRKSVMELCHRMVKSFSGILNMSGFRDFSHLSEVNNCGARVTVRKNTEPGQPDGMIVTAVNSIWLPLPPQNVFDFFRDEKRRVQWDVLSYGNPVNEIARVSTGTHPGNCISIVRPFIPTENNVLILQESSIDPLGSHIVYAPVDVPTIDMVIKGEDCSMVPILPSGFIISGDGRPVAEAFTSESVGRSGGTLLTVAFQILVCSTATIGQLNMETVASVNSLINSTVRNIKAALNCSDVD